MEKQKSIKGLLIYIFIGIIGILTLYPTALDVLPSLIEQQKEKGITVPPISIETLALLSLTTPLLLLIISLIVGFFTAHKVGLKSVVIHPNTGGKVKGLWRKGIKLAIIFGLLTGIIRIIFDSIFEPLLPVSFRVTAQVPSPLSTLSALLYGGIVEELLLRFGIISLLVLILWKVFDRKSLKPANWIFILSILISSLLFALGHYGATASEVEMTTFIWFRMLFLNGIGGLFFGWIYWKHNLELAMLSHMFAHVTNTIILILLFFM